MGQEIYGGFLLFYINSIAQLAGPSGHLHALMVIKNFSLLEFGIKVEYALQINFLFQMLNSSLISIYMQEVVTIGWMLS